VQRDTIAYEKDTDGRVWILLEADRTRHDNDQDTTGQRQDTGSGALISAKDETIATLREQLQAERQAHAEARRIIAGLVERIPAIEAPADERRTPETGEEEAENSLRQKTEAMERIKRQQQVQDERSLYWLFGILTAVVAGIAHPLAHSSLIVTAESPWANLAYALWIFPAIYGYWFGRSHLAPMIKRETLEIEIARLNDRLRNLRGDHRALGSVGPRSATQEVLVIGAVIGVGATAITVVVEAYRGLLGLGLESYLGDRPVALYLGVAAGGVFLSTLLFVVLAGLVGTGNAGAEAAAAGTDEYKNARMQSRYALIGVIITAVLSFLATYYR
jgi:hypothetical protein